MEKTKVAVFGTGFMGRVHVEALRRLGNVEVVAIAGRTAENARAFAVTNSIERSTGDYRELLADPEIAAVHICSPNALHFPMAKATLEANKHVLCEKPLASTVAEAVTMAALATDKKLANCTLYNIRSYPQVQNIRRMREAGNFGQIYAVQGTYSQDWLLYDTDWNWRVESGPSRTFADIGTHWCDLVEHVTGLRITSLCADLQTFHTTRKKPKGSVETFAGKTFKPAEYEVVPIVTEDFGAMTFRMGPTTRGALTVSQISAGRKTGCSLRYSARTVPPPGTRNSRTNSGSDIAIHRTRSSSRTQRCCRSQRKVTRICRVATAKGTTTPSSKLSGDSTGPSPIVVRRWNIRRSKTGFAKCEYSTRWWKAPKRARGCKSRVRDLGWPRLGKVLTCLVYSVAPMVIFRPCSDRV